MSLRPALLALVLLTLAARGLAGQTCTGTPISVPVTPGSANGAVSITDYDAGSILYFQSYQVDLTGTTGGTHTICVRAPGSTFTPAPWGKPSADITVRMIAPSTGSTIALSATDQVVASSTKKNIVTLEVRVALSYANDLPGSYANSLMVTVFK